MSTLLKGEFVPPPFDSSAQQGLPEVSSDLGYAELDATAFKVSVCGNIVVRDGKADIYLTNPTANEVWMKLRVLDSNGSILGETGLIKPGEYVKEVAFTVTPEGGAQIKLKIMTYEPNTYYSAGSVTLNTTVGG